MKRCSKPNCDGPYKAKGLCNSHYWRLQYERKLADGTIIPKGRFIGPRLRRKDRFAGPRPLRGMPSIPVETEGWAVCLCAPVFEAHINGAVRSYYTKRVLRPCKTKKGYTTIQGYGYRAFTHRLVTSAHIGLIPEGYQVNHKNGIKDDNCLANLEYVTPEENYRHAVEVLGVKGFGSKDGQLGELNSMARFNNRQVRVIKHLLKSGLNSKEIAKVFDAPVTTIHSIKSGNSWAHIQV